MLQINWLSLSALLRAFLRRFGAGIGWALLLIGAVLPLSGLLLYHYHHLEAVAVALLGGGLLLWLSSRHDVSQAGVFVMAAVALAFEVFLFFGFRRVFHNFLTLEELGASDLGSLRLNLIEQLLRLVFSLALSMLFLSMTSAALSAVYLAEGAAPLLLAPRHWLAPFLSRFTLAATSVSYMVAAMILPILLALGTKFGAAPMYYWLLPPALLLLTLPPLVLGCAITALLIRLFPVNRLQQVLTVTTLLGISLVVILIVAANPASLFKPRESEDFKEIAASINITGLDRLPGAWAARLLIRALQGEFSTQAALPLALSAGAALLVLAGLAWIYPRTWSRAQERTSSLRPSRGWWPASTLGLLWLKDLRLFARDAKEWSQLLMLAALQVIYLYNMKHMPADLDIFRWAVVLINLAILGFILAALNLRFTFSAMALEGPGVWCLLKSPLPRTRILWEKTLFSFLPLSGFALLLTGFAGKLLNLPPRLYFFSLGLSFVFAVVLHFLAVAFGLAQYRPPESDPVKMALSPGGIGYMAVSLSYVICGLILTGRLILSQLFHRAETGQGQVAVLLALSAALVVGAMVYSRRKLMTMEW